MIKIMKILKAVIIIILMNSTFISSQEYDLSYGGINEHIYGGVPSAGIILERIAYVVEFDHPHHIPFWVAYHIIPDYLKTPERKGQWKEYNDDPSIVDEAKLLDYQIDGQYYDKLKILLKVI